MNSLNRIYLITELEPTNQSDESPEYLRLSAIHLQPQNNNKQKGGDKKNKKKNDVGDTCMNTLQADRILTLAACVNMLIHDITLN